MQKIIVICGQTSTGKSDLAVAIAKDLKKQKINAEIISADSRQVYKGFDLGSGKITKKEMSGIPHYMLNVVSPKKTYTVDDYTKATNKIIAKMHKNNIVPIICGGTGFYIDAIANNIQLPQVAPNEKLRKELYKLSAEELYKKLKKLDPKRSKTIDPKNSVRLVRAIEIASALGAVPKLGTSPTGTKYDVLWIGLKLEPEILKQKIAKRFESRMKKGMVKEMQNLHDSGISWKRLEHFGLEYKWCSLLAQSLSKRQSKMAKIARTVFAENLQNDVYHYAKRQLTWFKRNKDIHWLDASNKDTLQKSKELVKDFLKIT